jgi:cbb3-type cytochrome oxidase maturation protein
MNLAVLIAVSIGLGLVGLVAFLWSVKNGQYEDLDGASMRILVVETDRDSEGQNYSNKK